MTSKKSSISKKSTKTASKNSPNSSSSYKFTSPHKNFKKNFIWNLVGALLNASISLFLMIAITRINGIDNAGIFSIGFAIACLVVYIGTYFGRVFQVTENPKISDKSFFIAKIIAVSAMIIISLFYLLIKNYDAFKFFIAFSLCIYKALEAFAEVIYGYFQKYEDLYLSGISLSLKAVIGFGIFLLIDKLTGNMLLSIIGLNAVSIFFLVTFDFVKMRKYSIFKSQASKSDIIKIFKVGFFPFALSFLSVLVINASKYAIDDLSTNEIQTYFSIILMPATVTSLAAQFIVYPLITTIRDYLEKQRYQKIAILTRKIMFIIFGFGLICCVAAWLIGTPVLGALYSVDLSSYQWLLVLIIIGAAFNAGVYALSNILICLRKLKSQTLIYTIISIISLILARTLVSTFSISGASYSYLISMVVLFLSFLALVHYIFSNIDKPNQSKI